MTDTNSKRKRARFAVTIALAVLTVIILLAVFFNVVNPIILDDNPFNDLIAEAIEIKIEQSRSQFQVGILCIGFLWGLLIAKDDYAKSVLSEWPELTLFICANLLFCTSILLHINYLNSVSNVYYIAGNITSSNPSEISIPDIFAENFESRYQYQLVTLSTAVVSTAFMLISAHKLKHT